MEDNFWNEYYKIFKKLNEKVFIYVINGNEVSEKEFKNYVLNGGRITNEKDNEKSFL